MLRARPIQAALASAASFAVGAALPLATAILWPAAHAEWAVAGLSLAFLAALGALAARVGRANVLKGTLRVTFWGAFAMALTAVIGRLFGVAA
jgi:VIT1/CCC1 family predicted Fe2+/Mn2+ transporter